jgi:hypothetical protein
MESRFNHDFSRVRTHTDARAAKSSAALHAHAYTVGQEIVFGEGQYAPHSTAGKHLLAHELAHTIQQGSNGGVVATNLLVGRADDVSEREANAAADSVMLPVERGATTPFSFERRTQAVLQRQHTKEGELTEQDELAEQAKLAEEEELEQPEESVCGPNVTAPVIVAIHNVKNAFSGSNLLTKELVCKGLLDPLLSGPRAWDINELHKQEWIHTDYGPKCATANATPACHASVQITKECHYAGSVNYVIFGTMCKLCYAHYLTMILVNPVDWLLFTKPAMLELINLYKGHHKLEGEPSANFEESKAWASAGYDGWPSGGSPPKGDRPNCKPACGIPYTGPRFTVYWFPFNM